MSLDTQDWENRVNSVFNMALVCRSTSTDLYDQIEEKSGTSCITGRRTAEQGTRNSCKAT